MRKLRIRRKVPQKTAISYVLFSMPFIYAITPRILRTPHQDAYTTLLPTQNSAFGRDCYIAFPLSLSSSMVFLLSLAITKTKRLNYVYICFEKVFKTFRLLEGFFHGRYHAFLSTLTCSQQVNLFPELYHLQKVTR